MQLVFHYLTTFESLTPTVQRYKTYSCIHSFEFQCFFNSVQSCGAEFQGTPISSLLSTLRHRGMVCCFVCVFCYSCLSFLKTSASEILCLIQICKQCFMSFCCSNCWYPQGGITPICLVVTTTATVVKILTVNFPQSDHTNILESRLLTMTFDPLV